MQRPTRSSAKSLPSQPVNSASSSQPVLSTSTFDPSMSDPDNRKQPPHLDSFALPPQPSEIPLPPSIVDPNLQAALRAILPTMLQQMNTRAPAPAPAPNPPAHRSHVKTRDPEPFDGSEPSKLRSFLSQCKMVFRSRPDDFRSDHFKIIYAVSWMKDTAQRWFEPNLECDDEDLPDFAVSWPEFEEALRATFGEPDPVAAATTKLENLVMRDHHHLNKYNVDFNEHSALTGFNERALYSRYYRGLAPRLKDALVYIGRPATLARLRERAQELDLRYWERKEEERTNPSASKTTTTPSRSSGTSSATYSADKSSTSHSKTASRSSTPAATPAASSSPNKPDLTKVLGPDGKLLPEEKERRKKNDLCLVCGAKGHFSDKCPLRKDSAQARFAGLDSVEESEDPLTEAEFSDSPN